MGRFVAEDVYWNAYNCIYSDNTDNSKTNAEEVRNLLGYGVDAGFGIGSVSIDLIGLDWESDEINGFKISAGGGAGIDIHLAKPYTEEIYTFNVYELILKLLGRSEYGNREIYDDGCLSVD
ncbi:MAG: hypothetical protein K2I96_17210 [Lachnospiraceae bacterium]|nr:hypothetical protein [Lachnospiraceae bacterium]